MNTEWIKNKKGQRIYPVSHAKAVVRGESTVDTDLKKIENHYTTDGTTLGRNMEYAIIYEWADGNLENENRIGYFVSLDTEDPTKIVKATKDSTVVGIVSYAPAFAGNAHAEMYDEDKKLLPQYAYVSIIGQIPVRYDETVTEIGVSVMPNDEGVAELHEFGYTVTQIVDENFALVLVELNSQALVELNTTLSNYVKRVGDIVLTDAPVYNTSNESYNKISGGSKGNNSASLTLYGKDNEASGSFILEAGNDTSQSLLVGQSNGRLQWAGKDIVRSINGNRADENGNVELGLSMPVGSVLYLATAVVPDGFLVCNGAEVSREDYADLFNIIGETFGVGDGTTTFALPNLMDNFIQGSSTVGTAVEAGLPNITGTFRSALNHYRTKSLSDDELVSGVYTINRIHADVNDTGTTGVMDTSVTMNASLASSIYGHSDTVQPPALTLLPCIKY